MGRLKEFVKGNKMIYSLYYYSMSAVVNIIKWFVKPDDKLILFVSYGGRHYSDSPRVIYEAMLKDERFKEYKLVWAFIDPEKYKDVSDKIKIDTIEYYKTALKACCWVTNVMIERALNFKGINTYYFFTTHGILPKFDGPDLKQYKFSSLAKLQYDACLIQSEFERSIAKRIFACSDDNILPIGSPKNDIFSSFSDEYRQGIREKLKIPNDKKAILYAPTFREDLNLQEVFDLDVEKWREELSNEYVLLYRAHPVVSTKAKLDDDFFRDVTSYEVVEDLMIASDILVSDYSGIVFDYCIMHKPIVLWTYDYEIYSERRGLYVNMPEELPSSPNEDIVIETIKKHACERDMIDSVISFQEKFTTFYGDATKKSLDIIYEKLAQS